MTKNTQSVSKTEWGNAKKIFVSHLPKILEQLKAGKTRTQIHTDLGLELSYRQFCKHLKKELASRSSSPSPTKSPAPDHKHVSSGGFVMPIINIEEEG